MNRLVWIQTILALCTTVWAAKEPQYQKLHPLREQAELQDAWTKERISNIPQLLQKYGVDAWLVR
jgi:hypothetical protein